MGLFKDSFQVGAGATLGSLATATGFNIGNSIVDNTVRRAYEEYRSRYFDPVIRDDLCEIMVKGFLPARPYPFPNGQETEKKNTNFFKRHMIFSAVLAFLGLQCFYTAVIDHSDTNIINMALLFMLVFFMGIVLVIMKIGKMGGKKFAQNTYKSQLESAGRQYWYIREYVRQALEKRELNVRDSILKISNTNLAQMFPDTVEEIEANAFYYRQRIGM